MGRPKSNSSKSNKYYCKKYCEKNKEKLKKKDWEYKKATREYEKYLHPQKYNQLLKKDRIRSREYRSRKTIEQSLVDQAASSSSTQDIQSSSSSSPKPSTSNESAFSLKQSFCRSILQAEKHLPNSPHKKPKL